jgi:hypothetical protein
MPVMPQTVLLRPDLSPAVRQGGFFRSIVCRYPREIKGMIVPYWVKSNPSAK